MIERDHGLVCSVNDVNIWLVNSALTPHDSIPIHRYKLRDESNQILIEHGGIWLIELNKCHLDEVATEQQRWLKLFVEGETLNDVSLPEWMQTPEMRKAMKVLHDFSEKEENYHIYASRLDYQRVQWTLENDAQESKADAAKARQELELGMKKFAQEVKKTKHQAAQEVKKTKRQAAQELKQAKRQAAQEVNQVKQQLLAAQEEIERLKSALR
jgi:hypothetical protein